MSAELVREARDAGNHLHMARLTETALLLFQMADALESAAAKLASISAAREKAKTTVSGRLAFTDQVRHILEGDTK